MTDTYTKTTTTSYGQRIKESFGKTIFGIILFFASFVVLWNNEGNNVKNIKKALFMEKNAISVSANEIKRENDSALIAVTGSVVPDAASLTDGKVTVQNSLSLKRNVEMYQWKEETHTTKKDNVGGSQTTETTYTYTKDWSSSYVDSSKFEHPEGHNNPSLPIDSARFNSYKGKLGNYVLNESQIDKIGGFVNVQELPELAEYKLENGVYYNLDADVNAPKIGDVRITYTHILSGANVSIMGQQNSDNTISKKVTDFGPIYLQYDGSKGKDEMIEEFRSSSSMWTNIMRLLGWGMMYFGLTMLIAPLVAIAKVLPFMADIVSFASGFVFFLISLILSLVTIALAWFAYRPLMSIILFAVVGGLVYVFRNYIKKKKEDIN